MKKLIPKSQNCEIPEDTINGKEYIFFLSDTYNARKGTNWKDVIIQIIHWGHKIY